ncbi:MAG: HAMP domain-containing protein [Balneolaceae bacterium]|nr:HAMP domain-containing protein [Balneolaceae bacterium]
MNIEFLSLRWKILAGFVSLVFVIVLSLLLSLGSLVEHRIREDIDQNFVEAGRVFERIQEIRFRQLRQTALLLAETPSLKAAITTADTNTVNDIIREDLLPLLDFDPIIPDSLMPESFFSNPDSAGLLLIADKLGKPLGRLSSTPLPTFSIADRAGVTEALNGFFPAQSYIWAENARYFNVITMPIFAGFNSLGTVSFGLPIRQEEANQLSKDIGMDVIFFVDDAMIANTFDALSPSDQEILEQSIHTSSFNVLQMNEAATSEIVIDHEQWLIYLAPMFNDNASFSGIKGYFGIAKSLDEALLPLQNLQLLIFGIGLLAVIAAIGISVLITKRITRPIYLLVEGVQRVENEDFSQPVPVTSQDEIGTLTKAFNHLVENLQERLLMLKFVSTATLDAIKKDLTRIEPGGERRDITVFFSDIRGFTSWSEKHTPEQVIDMLNNLLSFQAEIVQELGGDVDKFVGDELVAVFQGPKKDQLAVQAAIQIQQQLPSMLSKGQDNLAVGIGINSGEVVMGAMGSENRMDYTVLGTTVNLGARLCSAADKHQILISEAVFLNLERKISALKLESIQVKGISEPVQIFEIEWQNQQKSIGVS